MKVRLTYLGIDAEGPTVTAAKRAAVEKLERCMSEGFDPRIVSHPNYPDHFAVVLRQDVESWGYRLIDTTRPRPLVLKVDTCSGGFSSANAAVLACRRHMAQVVMDPASDEKSGIEFLSEPGDILTHLGYVAWQRDYRRLVAAGATPDEAHARAQRDGKLVEALTAKWLGSPKAA